MYDLILKLKYRRKIHLCITAKVVFLLKDTTVLTFSKHVGKSHQKHRDILCDLPYKRQIESGQRLECGYKNIGV